MHQLIRILAISGFAVASVLGFTGTAIPLAQADSVSGCGSNDFVQSVDPHDLAAPYAGHRKIKVTPGEPAWHAVGVKEVTDVMWHSIQDCVPGLYGRVADSIYQQLMCHQAYPVEFATGPTWDLETYHPPLSNPTWAALANTHCLNTLEPDSSGGGGGW